MLLWRRPGRTGRHRHRLGLATEVFLAQCKVWCKVLWMKSVLPKLKHAPVVTIIGQVRFSPVLSMESYLPKIQEELRKKGFPKYDKVAQQSLGFGSTEGGVVTPTTEFSW